MRSFLPLLVGFVLPLLSLASNLRGRLDLNSTIELGVSRVETDALARLYSAEGVKAVEILRDQTFLFTGLEKGVYRLSVASRLAKFQHYSVEVQDASEDPVVYIFQWGVEKQPTTGRVSLSVTPLVIPTIGKVNFKPPKASFNLLNVVKGNPLILIMIVGGLFTFLLPKILEMVDPEVLAEVTQNQRDLHSKMASVQSLDFSALLSSPSTSKEVTQPKEIIQPEISKVIDDSWMQEESKNSEGGKGKGKGGRKRK